ncbi:uncharacterized protein LOC117709914 isoform X2 [Arvicanthis niloticus]|uniref:uncharacterized protein LOC117709914 isoform X2 n=1 Tax=Arvicanthis niloticus TaxID=61156 RepID=UPI00402B3F09
MSPGTFSMSGSEPSAASLGGGRGEPRPRAQQSGWDTRGQRLGHRPSVYRQGERTCEVGLHFFSQLGSGDCYPPTGPDSWSPGSPPTPGECCGARSSCRRENGRSDHGEAVDQQPQGRSSSSQSILRRVWLLL